MTLDKSAGPRRWVVVAAVVVLVAIVGMIALSPHHLIYDEEGNQVGARYMAAGHSFKAMLLSREQMLAGPLFSLTQWALSPVTEFHAPAVRVINPLLLIVSVAAIWQTLRLSRSEDPFARSAALIGVPLIPLSTGLALTEMLPLALASLGVLLTASAMTAPDSALVRRYLGFALGGVAAGLATLARQPYLCATVGFVLVAVADRRWRWPALLAVLVAVLVPLPVFMTWGGLVPPVGAKLVGKLVPAFAVHSLAYLALVFLILAPGFYWQARRASLAGLAAGIFAVVILGTGGLHVASGPAGHLSAALRGAFELIAPAILIGGTGAFLAAASMHLWALRADRGFVLMMLLTVGMAVTPAAISAQFSSRYVLAAFPFAMFALQPFYAVSRWAAARLVLGGLIGMASLAVLYTT